MRLAKTYTFEAAHRLTRLPEGHPCCQVHGHSYRVEIMVAGDVDPAPGWLVDFGRLDEVWRPIALRLDHQMLNDVLPNPTAENLARWIWDQAEILLGSMLERITVWETADARCEYEGQ